MKKYIDADELKKVFLYSEDAEYARWTLAGILYEIDDIEAADVVEVVRCKDCKYAHMTVDGECKYCDIWFPNEKEYLDGDYYCASGERKDG